MNYDCLKNKLYRRRSTSGFNVCIVTASLDAELLRFLRRMHGICRVCVRDYICLMI